MLLLFLRHGAAESRTFMLGNCLNILNIHFITSPNFPKCKYLCMWTVMYHYRISVGQADIHRVCLKHLTHEAQEHCAVPWASSHSQGAHFPGSPKDTSGFSRWISPWGCLPHPLMPDQRHILLAHCKSPLCVGKLWVDTLLWDCACLHATLLPLSFG